MYKKKFILVHFISISIIYERAIQQNLVKYRRHKKYISYAKRLMPHDKALYKKKAKIKYDRVIAAANPSAFNCIFNVSARIYSINYHY